MSRNPPAAARPDVSYDLANWPVSQACVDSSLWNINLHRPPNGPEQVDMLAAAIRKVYENLDELKVEEHDQPPPPSGRGLGGG